MIQGKKWVAGGLMIVLLMAAIPLFAAALPVSGATASSELSPLTAAKAIDGDRGTFYSSQGHPDADHTEWLQLDLGSRQHAISGVRLDARVKGYGFPIDFKLQYSDNGTAWTDAPGGAFTNFSNPGHQEVSIPFTKPINARYLRLYATKLGHDDYNAYYLQINEFAVDQKYKATASSYFGTFEPGNAVDGSTDVNAGATAFYSSVLHSTAANTEWLQLDLGRVATGIHLVRLNPRQHGYGFPVDFKIQTSNSASGPWVDAPGAVFTNYNASSGAQVAIPFASPVDARYVRLYATKLGIDNGTTYGLQVVEMAVETAFDQTAKPDYAVSDSWINGWGAERLFDGIVGPVWSSAAQPTVNTPQSFTFHYGGKVPIHKLVLTPRAGGLAFPVDFTIQYSLDGTAFTSIPGQTYTNYPNPGSAPQVFEFDPLQAKAVRVLATKLGVDDDNTPYFQLAEATVYKWDTYSDTWAATDNLGRTLPAYSPTTEPREDKFVGMFYFLWLGQHGTGGPYDITKIRSSNPGAMDSTASPPWGPYTAFHHWGESLFGYYLSQDNYVLRKHAQMLADADVDTIIVDLTNGFTYTDQYMALLEVFDSIRNKGGKTPQVMFMGPWGDPTAVVQSLYDNLYSLGLYSDLWFQWEGKPIIIANSSFLAGNPTLSSFFTFRKPHQFFFDGPAGPNEWGWLEGYPQHAYYSSTTANEQVTVSIAQNAVPDGAGGYTGGSMSQPGARGRSYHDGAQPTVWDTERGYNFMEQWGRALDIDPKFVFVTGWNEWVAQRLDTFGGHTAPNVFVDVFSEEFSRDIEPMKGGYGDSYYYQFIDYVRRYKGVRKPQNADSPATMAIDGSFADWKAIQQEFRDDVSDTALRNDTGWGAAGTYTNTTGRNDFQVMKVARDADYIYFYVKTNGNITSYTDSNWMRLFIKTDEQADNWQGYNYVVNRTGVGATSTRLEKVASGGGWNWTTVSSAISYKVSGRELELAIPRASLGLADTTKPIRFEFKWHDNMQVQGDIYEFTANGDAAPNARFNYVFTEVAQ